MTHNIACCYLTHNHPDVVKRVLGKVLTSYDENGIDIYMYDSSTSDDTKEYIDKLIAGGAKNLFYVPVDAGIGGDGKMLQVLKGYGLQKEYDYIWPNKDRSCVIGDSAQKIQQESRRHYDCMMIDSWIPVASDHREYKPVYEREEFFKEFGWLTTSWEMMLISTDILLHTIEWESFEEKYQLGQDQNFNQPLTVFGGLALKEHPQIRVLSYKEVILRNDLSTTSTWINDTFPLWAERWPKAIASLPACYDPYKAGVIKDQGMHPNVFGSIDNLINLEQKNLLTPEVWAEYKEDWSTLSDIPPRYVEAVLAKDYGKIIQMSFVDYNLALQEQDHDKAYYILRGTFCISNLIGTTYYWMLRSCMDVYLAEVAARCEGGIMAGVQGYEDLIYKYQKLKFYLRRLEYDIPVPEEEMRAFICNNQITDQFACSIIEKECMDKEKALECWRKREYEG